MVPVVSVPSVDDDSEEEDVIDDESEVSVASREETLTSPVRSIPGVPQWKHLRHSRWYLKEERWCNMSGST